MIDCTGIKDIAISSHDIRSQKTVFGHAMLSGDPAEPAATRQPGDPGGRIDAAGNGKPIKLGLG
ncbi:hypothetical protein SAMN04487859_1149 [Roseovarius lutimaris]|uniref:Uncharacterized protein n=1 Tax=Roseovarius lutimaris TaxID=1005928 RepID=A0A1I5DYS7_9RHOB|nr:hypothetical protein SAMN04487859_1149 [Roseovarius lutimaris]